MPQDDLRCSVCGNFRHDALNGHSLSNSHGPNSGLRQELITFAYRMEAQLAANEHRGGWKSEKTIYLIDRIEANIRDLKTALTYPKSDEVYTMLHRTCADIANFAMMISDNTKPEVKP